MSAILQVQNITKSFGAAVVNKDVCMDVEEGLITSVIGPNGAGKTTLFNLITGFLKPDSGKVLLDGQDITGLPPYKIVHCGLSRTFQLVKVFPRLTLTENLMMGVQDLPANTMLSAVFAGSKSRKAYAKKKEEAREMLAYVGLSEYADHPANDLSYGQQKLVEIARALITQPKVLLVDEPLSGLNVIMIDKMLRLIDDIKKSGKTVIIIEHNTDIIRQISDNITVLNFGEVIASGEADVVLNDPAVIDCYLGIQ